MEDYSKRFKHGGPLYRLWMTQIAADNAYADARVYRDRGSPYAKSAQQHAAKWFEAVLVARAAWEEAGRPDPRRARAIRRKDGDQ